MPWLEKVKTMWSPALALPTISCSADITFRFVASWSTSTLVLLAVKPNFFKAFATSLASFTQPLSQLLRGSDLNSLIPTHNA